MLDLRRPAESASPAPLAPAPAGSVSPEPGVLLVSRTADAEFGLLARQLTAAGLPAVRLDAETIADAGLTIDLDRGAVLVAGSWLTPTVTWLRHFSHRAIPTSGVMPAPEQERRRAFASDAWRAVAGQLAVISTTTIAATGPGLLAQLALAKSLGVAVPRTVVTTDLAIAKDVLTAQRVVVKALHEHFVEASPGLLSGVFAEITDRPALPRGAVPPLVVQDYVAHETELRVYVVHGEVVATFSITKQTPADPWRAPERVAAALVEPPAEVVGAAQALAAAIPVEFGAFDFLLSGGTPVFLEVNLAGDWRWLETKVRATPVTDAAARLVSRLHAGAAPATRRRRVDPVTFLTGGPPRGANRR